MGVAARGVVQAGVILAVAMSGPAGAAEAGGDGSIQEYVTEQKLERLTPAHRESIERREAVGARRGDRGKLHQFRGQDGGLTLTNRPEKYRNRGGFVEMEIKYEPIAVPPEYAAPPEGGLSERAIHTLISRYAAQYRLDENLVYAVIKVESNFNSSATSKKGARGLMQLMPATAAEMGVDNIFDPAQNIAGGTQYLAKLMGLFRGDQRLALAGYNAGPEVVKRYKKIPPYKETQAYVRDVLAYIKRFQDGGVRMKVSELARMRLSEGERQRVALDAKRFVVRFHSGLTQPAEDVWEEGGYYYIKYGKRTYPVPKRLVEAVEEPG